MTEESFYGRGIHSHKKIFNLYCDASMFSQLEATYGKRSQRMADESTHGIVRTTSWSS